MNATAMRASVVVAAVYGYFLIFAQFAFVELVRAGGMDLHQEKIILGAMAFTGIAGGFFSAWRGASPALLRCAMGAAVTSAVLAPFGNGLPAALGVAVVTGGALGVATVSLAALLPAWCGVLSIGLGTGLGYAACNLPTVFLATPAVQAWTGAAFLLVGLISVPSGEKPRELAGDRVFPLWGSLAVFTALVWLDSAAFFIIQHERDLKSGTWGSGLLWRNAAVHLVFALVAGLWLARGRARWLPVTGWGILAIAALAVNGESTRHLAGWLYPVGVSLYSTALVAWPGWFSGRNDVRGTGWTAAWLFAVAGWFGSANGIGMVQTLHRVPVEFVAIAGVVMLSVMVISARGSWRCLVAVGAVALLVWIFPHERKSDAAVTNAVERGHEVYLSEGCIHCHSRYVRPGSRDELDWGPPREVAAVLKEQPVLIGNRRQGPDLSNVGARRSATWLKLHFIDPRAFAPDSPMPSYAHLFASRAGDDLISFLAHDSAGNIPAILETASHWQPSAASGNIDARTLFATQCATCHGREGRGDGPLSPKLSRSPANLVTGPFVWTAERENQELRVARVIKFGLPGTDMPGHEALQDSQIKALAGYVLGLRQRN